MAREFRQNHHHTGDMRFRVNKQHGETYKCQRGDHHFHSHKKLPSEHPQSTIRMKRQIVSRYLRSFCTESANLREARTSCAPDSRDRGSVRQPRVAGLSSILEVLRCLSVRVSASRSKKNKREETQSNANARAEVKHGSLRAFGVKLV